MNGTVPDHPIPLVTGAGDSSPSPVLAFFLYALLPMAIIAIIASMVSDKFVGMTTTQLYFIVIVVCAFACLTWYFLKIGLIRKWYNYLIGSPRLLLAFSLGYIVITIVLFIIVLHGIPGSVPPADEHAGAVISANGASTIPAFQVTSPHADEHVGSNITVNGIGAFPGNLVSVWVIDNDGRKWLEGQTFPTGDGTWSLTNVPIGRSGLDTGITYSIFAQTENKEGKLINSNSISVIRE